MTIPFSDFLFDVLVSIPGIWYCFNVGVGRARGAGGFQQKLPSFWRYHNVISLPSKTYVHAKARTATPQSVSRETCEITVVVEGAARLPLPWNVLPLAGT
jgi:hypothetical protein